MHGLESDGIQTYISYTYVYMYVHVCEPCIQKLGLHACGDTHWPIFVQRASNKQSMEYKYTYITNSICDRNYGDNKVK